MATIAAASAAVDVVPAQRRVAPGRGVCVRRALLCIPGV